MPQEQQSNSTTAFLRNLRLSKGLGSRLAIFLVLALSLTLLFPAGAPIDFDYAVGGVWAQKDLIAPFSFPIYRDERQYSRDVEEAKKKAYPVFERDVHVEARQEEKIRGMFEHLEEIISLQRTVRHGFRSSRILSVSPRLFRTRYAVVRP